MLPSQTDMFLPVLEFFVAVATDPLGFDPIFTRAKRYNSDSSIGLEIIQAFVGTLGSAKGGAFLTTASFTSWTRNYEMTIPTLTSADRRQEANRVHNLLQPGRLRQ